MKENVPAQQAVTSDERPLPPPAVQEALGKLVGAAQEGLMALSVGVGLGVLAELRRRPARQVPASGYGCVMVSSTGWG